MDERSVPIILLPYPERSTPGIHAKRNLFHLFLDGSAFIFYFVYQSGMII